MRQIFPLMCLSACLITMSATAQNTSNSSFSKAKEMLLKNIYTDYFQTVYCGATYDPKTKKIVTYPDDFNKTVLPDRAERIEYEHIVPTENFGRFFSEWREGSILCRDSLNRKYKGRKCAEKANIIYGLMQADMYNLYPAIGSVNGARSNLTFTQLPENIPSSFGGCPFKIADRKAEPPESARGIVGRTTLYFEEAYAPRYKLSDSQRKLMQEWATKYPVTKWECTRTYRIELYQASENKVVKEACMRANLWPTKEEMLAQQQQMEAERLAEAEKAQQKAKKKTKKTTKKSKKTVKAENK